MQTRPGRTGPRRIGALLLALAAASPGAASAASPDVVLSEVYVGGGTTTSAYDANFVELFNRGGATVGLAGWSLQARLRDGSWAVAPLAGAIAPGRYLLVRLTPSVLGGSPLPAEDASVSLPPLEGEAIALVTDAMPLACETLPGECATAATVRDLLGWGAATAAEGAPASRPGDGTLGLSRVFPGSRRSAPASACRDGDANATDFQPKRATPTNSTAPPVTCPPPDAAPTVVETIPANGAVEVDRLLPLTIRFSEPVGLPRVAISCPGLNAELETSTGEGIAFTVAHPPFGYGSDCLLTIAAASVADLDRDDPPDGLAADVVIEFTTVAKPPAATLASLAAVRATAGAEGRLTLPVRCSAQADDTCTGTVVLTMAAPKTSSARRPRRIEIGRASFALNRGTTRPVALRLGKAARDALAGRGQIQATATVRSTDAAGTSRVASSPLAIEARRAPPPG